MAIDCMIADIEYRPPLIFLLNPSAASIHPLGARDQSISAQIDIQRDPLVVDLWPDSFIQGSRLSERNRGFLRVCSV